MDKYFVPKRYKRWKMVVNRELLWKQSFPIQDIENNDYITWTGKTMAAGMNFLGPGPTPYFT